MEITIYKVFCLKLFLAVILGGVIGLERKLSNKAAGFRTMILICMGSMLFTDIGVMLASRPEIYGDNIDVSRMLGQIIAGIGFLGAGSIMKNYVGDKRQVEGLTTAAAIWLMAAVGVFVGLGLYVEAAVSTFAAAIVLFVFGKYEPGIVSSVKNINGKFNKNKAK